MDFNLIITDYLVFLLDKKQLTVSALARRLKLKRSTVHCWFIGTHVPRIENLYEILNELDSNFMGLQLYINDYILLTKKKTL